jgi:hypothetical protein
MVVGVEVEPGETAVGFSPNIISSDKFAIR